MSTFIERATQPIDRWLFHSNYVTARGQAAFRIFCALYLLLFFTPGQHDYRLLPLADLPSSLYGPPLGPMMFADGLPSAFDLRIVTFTLTLALVFVLIGWHTRTATALAALSILLLEGFGNSLGKVSHGGLLTGYMMLVMVFSSWGRCYSLDSLMASRKNVSPPDPTENSWVGPMVAAIAGLMYLSAGLAKVQAGWLVPSSHATENIADTFLFNGDGGLLTEFLLKANVPQFWEIGDYMTIFFEVGLVFAAVRLTSLRAFFVFAIVFHILNYLILNIPFATIIAVYALFLPWEAIIAWRGFTRIAAAVEPMATTMANPFVPVAVAVPLALGLHEFGSPILRPLEWAVPGDGVQQAVVYGLSVAVVVACLAGWLGRNLRRAWSVDITRPIPGDTGRV